jgi:hypothetical protein
MRLLGSRDGRIWIVGSPDLHAFQKGMNTRMILPFIRHTADCYRKLDNRTRFGNIRRAINARRGPVLIPV